MDSLFICPRCGNRAIEKIGYIGNKPYCRACIAFNGDEADDRSSMQADAALEIDYALSKDQQQLSEQIVAACEQGIDTLIHAVTGAGKTELVFAAIQKAVMSDKHVGFAIPRRDVVIELGHRFSRAFPHLDITSVYGGHHEQLSGHLVVLTTHQIYRYIDYFDLLIVDEYDAFPYRGNTVLEALLKRSRRGVLIALTATPTPSMIEQFEAPGHQIVKLWTRYHQHPLPVPRTTIRWSIWKLDWLIDRINHYRWANQPLLVFVPTIAIGTSLFKIIRLFTRDGALAHSKVADRVDIVDAFKKGRYRYLVSTSILERGITLTNLQVIIYDSHHELFDAGMLIQMAGRVGRRKSAPTGDVHFLARRATEAMKAAIAEIEYANTHL